MEKFGKWWTSQYKKSVNKYSGWREYIVPKLHIINNVGFLNITLELNFMYYHEHDLNNVGPISVLKVVRS